jgi:hypothetical protein
MPFGGGIHSFCFFRFLYTIKVLECYAYYLPATASDSGSKVADRGTTLRFVERPATSGNTTALPLPGLVGVEATYDKSGTAAYADHWVSNVIDREGFLTTLEDCLGFTPKVRAEGGGRRWGGG